MIPVLYDVLDNLYTPPGSPTYWNVDNETLMANLTSHKIGALAETLSCKVTESRNGQYELVLTYPANGYLANIIVTADCIMAKPNQVDDPQLFRIYRITRTLKGIMTIYARHISYDLCGLVINMSAVIVPSTKTPAGWMRRIFQNTYFSGQSTITSTNDIMAFGLMSCRAVLGGVDGSILDTFGGEYRFDNFVVHLDASRGSDKGIILEYGKNITDLTDETSCDQAYTGIRACARYYNSAGEEVVKVIPEITIGVWRGYKWIKILDVTERLGLDSGVVPTDQQIEDAAMEWYYDSYDPYMTTLNVSVIEPSKYATLGLCDTVQVRHRGLAINELLKVVTLEYDTLLEKYTKITLGQISPNLAGTVNDLETAVASLRKDKPIFSSGNRTVDLSDGRVNAIYGANVSTLRGTGLTFKDGTASSRLRVIKRTMDSADSTDITLEHGAYLAIVTHTNNSTTTQQGLYLIQCYNTSAVTPIVAAANSTLSISGDTLTWTTTNTYRALRLILLT